MRRINKKFNLEKFVAGEKITTRKGFIEVETLQLISPETQNLKGFILETEVSSGFYEIWTLKGHYISDRVISVFDLVMQEKESTGEALLRHLTFGLWRA